MFFSSLPHPIPAADNGESTFGDIPNGQWMTQSFTDQIPSFSNHCGMQEQEGNHV